jgi:uncharacterized protein YecT (DUF1311 family)
MAELIDNSKTIEILKTERACVERNINNQCDRECAKCDLLREDAEILQAYDNAIKVLATESEIRAKAIDEFAEKLNQKITEFVLAHQSQLTFVSGVSMGWKFVDEIAEQLKERE